MSNYCEDKVQSHNDTIHEIAAILAAGVLRLRSGAAVSQELAGPKTSAKSGRNCLEVPAETVLSVTGVNGFRDLERGTKA